MHRQQLEVGDGRKFVPLDRLFAEVKVFQPERDAAQEEVLSKRLSTKDAQLKLTKAKSLFAVAAVHELWMRRSVNLHSNIPKNKGVGFKTLSDHLIKRGVPRSPGDLGFTLGGFVWVWKQISLHVRVRICSVFRNLRRVAN